MANKRPVVLSIAGFDPSAGAGILADIKTFENIGVYGLGVCTALTIQNDKTFEAVNWVSQKGIIAQIKILQQRFKIDFVKIGIIENWSILSHIIDYLKKADESIQIILDPVFQSSTGFRLQQKSDFVQLEKVLKSVTLLTPNLKESEQLTAETKLKTIQLLSTVCPIFLKGGHSQTNLGKDVLWSNGIAVMEFEPKQIAQTGKHGSGCVLSSAITAYLAKGELLVEACEKGKDYIEGFLNSNNTLLGYHSK